LALVQKRYDLIGARAIGQPAGAEDAKVFNDRGEGGASRFPLGPDPLSLSVQAHRFLPVLVTSSERNHYV